MGTAGQWEALPLSSRAAFGGEIFTGQASAGAAPRLVKARSASRPARRSRASTPARPGRRDATHAAAGARKKRPAASSPGTSACTDATRPAAWAPTVWPDRPKSRTRSTKVGRNTTSDKRHKRWREAKWRVCAPWCGMDKLAETGAAVGPCAISSSHSASPIERHPPRW